jgi:hypothetical protein
MILPDQGESPSFYLTLETIEPQITNDQSLSQGHIATHHRVYGIHYLCFRQAAHADDLGGQLSQLCG